MHNAYQGLSDSSNNKPVCMMWGQMQATTTSQPTVGNRMREREREGPKGKEEKKKTSGWCCAYSQLTSKTPSQYYINVQCARTDGYDGHDSHHDNYIMMILP